MLPGDRGPRRGDPPVADAGLPHAVRARSPLATAVSGARSSSPLGSHWGELHHLDDRCRPPQGQIRGGVERLEVHPHAAAPSGCSSRCTRSCTQARTAARMSGLVDPMHTAGRWLVATTTGAMHLIESTGPDGTVTATRVTAGPGSASARCATSRCTCRTRTTCPRSSRPHPHSGSRTASASGGRSPCTRTCHPRPASGCSGCRTSGGRCTTGALRSSSGTRR